MVKSQKVSPALVLGGYGLIVAFLVARTLFQGKAGPLFLDNDDAMRMVVVRDLLDGQNWFDHIQYRLNTPFGAQIHWSRLIDLPIAALVLVAGPFAGTQAEAFAGYVWPLILLLPFLWLLARLSQLLAGPGSLLPSIILAALSLAVMNEFTPGRVDHHSVQIIITLAMVLWTIEALARPSRGWLVGLASATSLAIGTENLPAVLACVVIFGLFYVFSPERARTTRNFGIALGLGTLGHLALALPPDFWLVPACDAISVVYASAALAAGLVLALLSLAPVPQRSWPVRMAAGLVLGGAVLVGLAMLFPECLEGPYANLDPWLVDNWLRHIGEAKPIFLIIWEQPAYVVSAAVPLTLALIVASIAIWRERGNQRVAWMIFLGYLVLIVLVAFLQVRTVRIAASLAIPAGAYAILVMRRRYLASKSFRDGLGLVGTWIGFAGTIIAVLVALVVERVPHSTSRQQVTAESGRLDCIGADAFVDLAEMAPERVMTPVDLGAFILLWTPHSVVSAPYHRNTQGISDTLKFFNRPIGQVRKILEERGIGLVVTCPALPEMAGLPDTAPDSFVRLVREGELPDWLVDVSLPGAILRVYAVLSR